jgi:hypothetical protein
VTITVLFTKLRDALNAVGIPYFVTGSFASSVHGVPRSTNDIDIVIAPTEEQLRQLLLQFPQANFATDLEDPFEAFRNSTLFNIVDYATMWKIDFIFKQETPFDTSRLARRRLVEIAGVQIFAASPEDILITKLWWAKLGESERQINDVAGILRVQGDSLDRGYIERWVTALDLSREWARARTS